MQWQMGVTCVCFGCLGTMGKSYAQLPSFSFFLKIVCVCVYARARARVRCGGIAE